MKTNKITEMSFDYNQSVERYLLSTGALINKKLKMNIKFPCTYITDEEGNVERKQDPDVEKINELIDMKLNEAYERLVVQSR